MKQNPFIKEDTHMTTQGAVFENRLFMLDFARMRSFRRDEMILILDILEKSGYNGLGLYIEGAYLSPERGGIPRPGCLTQADADWLKQACETRGLALFPMTNIVYHMEHFLTQERYADLRDPGGHARYQIHIEMPEARAFVRARLHELQRMFGCSMLHIGGDEAVLAPERLPGYAAFVAELCREFLAEGVTPAIWGDLLYDKQELAPLIPRETVIFDWQYDGHRPESPRFFREQGFTVYTCPCDNGWTGFINGQRSWSREVSEEERAEVEAFLRDGADAGCKGGVMTHWEDINGHSIWSAMTPIVRAGLYMSGRWNDSLPEAEQVEPVLFGHITPYTEITHILRRFTVGCTEGICPGHTPCHGIWHEGLAQFILKRPAGCWKPLIDSYTEADRLVTPMLDAWVPADTVETLCKKSLIASVAAVRAARALMLLCESRRCWHEAALAQFDPEARKTPHGSFEANTEQVLQCIDDARSALCLARDAFLDGIRGTGISDIPTRVQRQTLALLDGMRQRVTDAVADDAAGGGLALQSWHELVEGWMHTTGGLVQ